MGSPCLDLAIGASEAALLNLRYRGLPDPDEWTYQPYSRVETGGDGRSRGFGFPVASWSWNFLSQRELNILLDFFAAATDASVSVYITTYIDSGPGASDMTANYKAIMHRPTDNQGKSMINESRLPTYSDVTVQFTHLETP